MRDSLPPKAIRFPVAMRERLARAAGSTTALLAAIAGAILYAASALALSSTPAAVLGVARTCVILSGPSTGNVRILNDLEATCGDGEEELDLALPGSAGPVGPAGPAGPQGPSGPQGDKGPSGIQGPAGFQGTAGLQGAAGAPGATGSRGATGSTGPDGSPGAAGPDGDPGAQGAAGPQGAAG